MVVSIQLSTVNNNFKANVLKATQEIVEYYLEYRRKTIINTKLVLLEKAIVNFWCIYKNPQLYNITRIF